MNTLKKEKGPRHGSDLQTVRAQMARVPGRCYDRCEVCGELNYFQHDYRDGRCVRCGEPAPLPRQKLSHEESMANSDEGIGSGGVRGGW
jgi:ribosomal protein S14